MINIVFNYPPHTNFRFKLSTFQLGTDSPSKFCGFFFFCFVLFCFVFYFFNFLYFFKFLFCFVLFCFLLFFTVKVVSVTLRLVSQENAFKKSKKPSFFSQNYRLKWYFYSCCKQLQAFMFKIAKLTQPGHDSCDLLNDHSHIGVSLCWKKT